MSDRIGSNIDLAFRFLAEAADDPSIIDEIEDGSTLVLLPPDRDGDPQLTTANLDNAQRLAAAGRRVTVWRVETPSAGGHRVFGRWPVMQGGRSPAIAYDRARDVLEIDLLSTDEPTMPVRNRSSVVRIDPGTGYVVGVTVPKFLAEAAQKSLLLFDLLLQPSARLEGISREELREIRNVLAYGKAPTPAHAATTEQIAEELLRLTA